MSDTVSTVKVMPWSEDQGEFVVINESDFDPKKHELFDTPKQDASQDQEAGTDAGTEPARRGRKAKQEASQAA